MIDLIDCYVVLKVENIACDIVTLTYAHIVATRRATTVITGG